MRRTLALIFSTVFLILAALIIFGILLGAILKLPGFDQLVGNIIFLVLAACLALGGWLLRVAFRNDKNETSIPIPNGASPAVIQAIKALDSNDPQERERAIQNLGQMSDPTARQALVNAVERHPTRDVRFQAGFKLAELKDGRGIPAIIEALKHPNQKIRFHAATILGQVGFISTDSVDSLLETLETDKDREVRWAASISLGQIGDKRAVPGLLKALANEKDRAVVEGVIAALGKLGDASIVPILVPVFKRNDNPTGMIKALVTALRRIGTPEAMAVVEPYRDHWDYWERNI